ncbi:MAG: hypothetical protein AB7P33_05260 [Dehalococcoidia bacterium]
MIESWPESAHEAQTRFDNFRTTIQAQCTDVRFAVVGGNILVVGTVPVYTQKALIEFEAENHGLTIQNCVRVVPGREWFVPETSRLAG